MPDDFCLPSIMVIPSLGESYSCLRSAIALRVLLQSSPIDDLLFGQNLGDRLKANKSALKVSQELFGGKSTRQQGNSSGLPASRGRFRQAARPPPRKLRFSKPRSLHSGRRDSPRTTAKPYNRFSNNRYSDGEFPGLPA